jgi:hypothetical protein
MKTILRSWSVVALCAALGCGGTQPSTTTPDRSAREDKDNKGRAADGLASLIATVPSGTIGPYIGYGPKGAMALFSPHPDQGSERRWHVQPLDEKGDPLKGPYDIGPAPEDVPFAIVRSVGESYLSLWVRQVHRADVLEGILIGPEGSLEGSIHTMTQARGEVLWADAYATGKGTVVLWAEQSGDRANLHRMMLDDKGAPVGNADVLVKDVRAWEAVGLDDGVAIALVVVSDQDPTLGSVVLQLLDEAGKARGEPVAVSRGGSARLDVGLVRTRRSLLMAWTDRAQADTIVHAATTDLKGRLMVAARAPLPPLGDQALVALIEPSRANPDQALLVYEELPSRSTGHRELRLANLSAEAVVSEQTVRLAFSPVGLPTPDFGSTPDGFVLLTRAQACAKGSACEEVPWYIRLGSTLSVEGAGPLIFDALHREPPALVWSPGCTGSTCLALAVGGSDPAKVVAARLPKGSVAPGVPIEKVVHQPPPRPQSNRAVHISGESLSAVDVTTSGKTTFLGFLTHFPEGLGANRQPPPGAPGDPKKPTAAHLGVQRLDASGQPTEAPTMISVRAMSAGGLALAPSTKAEEVCVAWVARDNGVPQVFLTRVGADGKSLLQRMITHSRGDVADVAIAAHGDGWIVAWVDWRDGNGEVYVTRVNGMLVKQGPEKRITQTPGDASDLSLLVMGDDLLVSYGDTRDHPTHATANPYVQKLNAKTLVRIGEERRVDSSEFHAKGVQLSRLGQDVVMAWLIQSSPGSAEAERGAAKVSRLDVETLRLLGEPTSLGTEGAVPASLKLSCERDACHGAMMVSVSGSRRLEGFSWWPGTSRVHRGQLARGSGPSAADITPALIDESVFFVDQGVDGSDRIRRVQVQWRQ